jgi:hypothetical protein
MAWLNTFFLGRPGLEIPFEVPPEAMMIDHANIEVNQRNILGDMKTSIIKVNTPSIKINSSYLSIAQRVQLMSLMSIVDTFLSFQCRNDWQSITELVTIVDANDLQIANSSATRLSAALVAAGAGSIITINTPFYQVLGSGYGEGGYGQGGYGGQSTTFNPGTLTYTDATRIINFANALPNLIGPYYVTYTYTGWLVKMAKLSVNNKGGWLDRSTYDIELTGA